MQPPGEQPGEDGNMDRPPPVDRIPEVPVSWYLFGRSSDLRARPVSKDILGKRLVAWRTASGRAVVLDGRCAHLGADLGLGRVTGDGLQCPFHHWEYGPDGRCRSIPAGDAVPPCAAQACYPAVERHGYLYFFNGPKPLFPLPFFAGEDPDRFAASRPLGFDAECPWYLPTANSFDEQHFRGQHDRQLVSAPLVDQPAPFARRIRFTAAVVGGNLHDRLLRRFAGDRVDVSITNWAGVFVVVTGTFARTTSYLIVHTRPLCAERSRLEVLIYCRKGPPLLRALFDPLKLEIRRWLTHGFMAEEFVTLAGIRYNPETLRPGPDQNMIDFFRWLTHAARGQPEPQPEAVFA
jgi:nitrite reductase/ring-hydroxylating ferredoxin subunit